MDPLNVEDGRLRVIIEHVSPEIDGGQFPIKRSLGEEVKVSADIFADGHDVVAARLRYRRADQPSWAESKMEPLVNDRWQGAFRVTALGGYHYTIEAWVDHFQSWRRDLEKKFKAGQDVEVELAAGAPFLERAILQGVAKGGAEAQDLEAAVAGLANGKNLPISARVAVALSPRTAELMERYGPREGIVRYTPELQVVVDPFQATFSAWYEMFPRSAAPVPGRHGTFKDCEAWLPHIAKMGFDVLYFPPIHPIGHSFRKGKNNSVTCAAQDPGSPWAIGSEEGGHKAVHPQLGTLEDFRHLVEQARGLKIGIALDIAFQCSPDHSWVREHPQWFRWRSDGSIQYAENPPKKYQDIYPLNFETEDWRALWQELKSVFEFWMDQGVSIFRVDNPHTKSFRFWEWCLGELRAARPELIFLAEAFTRPKAMYHLAKVGFSQSYNYFPWRNTKYELVQYLTELAQTEVREFFRPNLWPNTPDILTQHLRYGGRGGFMSRLILAATLGASYGIYGPPYEICENQPREPDSEEYLNSEKYEIRHWNLNVPGDLAELIGRINQIRRGNAALQSNTTLRFHDVDNDQLIAYSKSSEAGDDLILVIVNLDPHHTQHGWVNLPLTEWDIGDRDTYQLHDLLTEARYLWSGPRNFVQLDPQFVPAHIFRLRRYSRTERDFDYFM